MSHRTVRVVEGDEDLIGDYAVLIVAGAATIVVALLMYLGVLP